MAYLPFSCIDSLPGICAPPPYARSAAVSRGGASTSVPMLDRDLRVPAHIICCLALRLRSTATVRFSGLNAREVCIYPVHTTLSYACAFCVMPVLCPSGEVQQRS